MLDPRLKTHVFVVVLGCSDICGRLLRSGFKFSSAGRVDRGDGYVILRKPVQHPEGVIEILARSQVTACREPRRPPACSAACPERRCPPARSAGSWD